MSFVDDEKFETFQRIEQFGECDVEPMIAPQLLAEKHRGEDGAAPFGVGLKMPGPLPLGSSEAEQPQKERSQCGDEQKSFEALGAFRSCVTQCEPESVALEVANGLLDLHALRVDAFDSGTGAAVMRQRSGEQPWGAVHLPIRRATRADTCEVGLVDNETRAPDTVCPSTGDGATGTSGRCDARARWLVGTANG